MRDLRRRRARGLPLALAAALAGLCCLPCASGVAAAQDGTPRARVTVPTVAMRSGPGAGFRMVRVAEQGEIFPVRERASVGYWLKLQLPDATYAWVPGDAVYVHEADEGSERSWDSKVFAPPPLLDAKGEVAVLFGVLDTAGFMAVRPSWLLSPTFGIELTGAAAVSSAGRTFLLGLGGVVNLFPQSPVVPFATAGGGFAHATPNSDSFVLKEGSSSMTFGGGGLRVSFRKRITLRVESRAVVFFGADRFVAQPEVSGGLTVFF